MAENPLEECKLKTFELDPEKVYLLILKPDTTREQIMKLEKYFGDYRKKTYSKIQLL